MPSPKRQRAAIYARVSTFDQNPTLQLRELRAYARQRKFTVVGEFVDKASGTKEDRPALKHLWHEVRAGQVDIVLVWKFDRFARSLKQLVNALAEFQHLGVNFVSYTQQIDTSSPTGKLVFGVISSMAEFERDLTSERVKAGLAKARAEGKRLGNRPLPVTTSGEIPRLHSEGLSLREIAQRLGISKSAAHTYIPKPESKTRRGVSSISRQRPRTRATATRPG